MRKEANIMAFMLALLAAGLLSFSAVAADVLIYTQATNQIIEEFRSLSARFGPSLPPNGLRGLAYQATPDDGCTEIAPPPKNVTFHDAQPKWVALIVRFNCSFEVKVRNAQEAGYDGVIVYNKGSNELEQMSANDDSDIFIPSVFVGETAGKIIIYDYQYDEGFALVLNDDFPFNINTHLILPFCIVVGLCFVIMLGFMVARCVRERRRILRYRLPRSSLRKLETRKFNKNENYETCAICLDDYEEGDRLRILPCNHAYHIKCIDPWLTKNRRVCPVCKRKVYINGERRSRRNGRRRSSTSDSMSSVDDTTNLINPVESNPNHGTFPRQAADHDDDRLDPNLVSDDEILDGRPDTRPSSGRFNPFDRVPNLPPQLVNELYPAIAEDQLSSWDKFKRFFRRSNNYTTLNIQDDDVPPLTDDIEASSASVRASSTTVIPSSSNNILNANLSGSFRDESHLNSVVVQDDDEILDGRKRNSSKRRHERKNRSAPELQTSDEPTTSSSMIGVAALPNVDFNLLRNPYHDQSNA